MDTNKTIQAAVLAAQKQENETQRKIEKIYIVGDEYFFSLDEVGNKEIDHTLIRSDVDPKMKTNLGTEKNFKNGGGF